MKLRDAGFLLAFSTALLPLASVWLISLGVPANLAAWFPLLFIFGVVPVIDALCGIELTNADSRQEQTEREQAQYFRVLTLLIVPIWLALLAWCMWQAQRLPFGLLGLLGWTLSTGVIGGTLAINTAHELIHKNGWLEPAAGGVLLSSVGYQGFKVEHVRGHHLHVATPEDSSSARLGESAYAFVPRALWRNVRNAWVLEVRRLRGRGLSPWSWRNEMVLWYALWLGFALAATATFGTAGGIFFLAQGLIAAATLEVINYVEHYGLQRKPIAPGRYERVTHRHSWNAPQRYTNWLLFNLQRHSDHHAQARRRYQSLLHHADAPQLPAGYASMFVLALLPPLWHRVMDGRALAQRS